jgi:hypothetical protein
VIGVDWSSQVLPEGPPAPAPQAPPEAPKPAPAPSPSPKPSPSPSPKPSPPASPKAPASTTPKAPAGPAPKPAQAPPAPLVPPPAGKLPGTAATAALARLNELRARHGAPALEWDAGLGAAAEAAAAACGGFHLRPAGSGETLARGYKDFPSAVDGWYARGDAYDWGRPGPQPGAAPFAQALWAGARRAGCARSAVCTRPFYACIYSAGVGG